MTFPFGVTTFLKISLSSPYYLVDSLASHLPVMMGAGDVVDSGVDGGDGAPVGEVLPSKSPLPSAAAALARFHTSQLSCSLKQLPLQRSSHSSNILSYLKQLRDQNSAQFPLSFLSRNKSFVSALHSSQLSCVTWNNSFASAVHTPQLSCLTCNKSFVSTLHSSQLSCVTLNNSFASPVHTSQLSCLTWSKCLTRIVHSSQLFCFNWNNCLTRTVHTAINTFTISFWSASKVTWKFPGFLDGNCKISTFHTKDS